MIASIKDTWMLKKEGENFRFWKNDRFVLNLIMLLMTIIFYDNIISINYNIIIIISRSKY